MVTSVTHICLFDTKAGIKWETTERMGKVCVDCSPIFASSLTCRCRVYTRVIFVCLGLETGVAGKISGNSVSSSFEETDDGDEVPAISHCIDSGMDCGRQTYRRLVLQMAGG